MAPRNGMPNVRLSTRTRGSSWQALTEPRADPTHFAVGGLLYSLVPIAFILALSASAAPATPTALTQNDAFDRQPSWSPDGSRIAFISSRSGTSDIYMMDRNGNNQTNLTRNNAENYLPSWSPDGARIAFTSLTSRRGGTSDIYVMDRDGSNQTNLTQDEAGNWSTTWSPDGARIAFEAAPIWHVDIYMMDADGKNQVNVTQTEAEDRYPSWSPDGTQIAFASDRDGRFEIYTMDADGANPQRLTQGLQWDYQSGLSWSPDGTRIAFASWGIPHTGTAISVMDVTGGNRVELTHPTLASLVTTSDGIPYSTHEVYVDHWYPRWSPDGTQIAFTSDRDAVFHFDKTTGGFAHESTGIYVVGLSETVAGVRSGGHGLTMWGKVKSP